MAETFDDSVNDCKSTLKNDLNNTLHGNLTHDGSTHNDCISAPAAKAIFIVTFTLELLIMLCMCLLPHNHRVFPTDHLRFPATARFHPIDDDRRNDHRAQVQEPAR